MTDRLRLPWLPGAETGPKGRIRVKLGKHYPQETLWKLVVFCVGNVRMDLRGAEGRVTLRQRAKNSPGL